MNVRLRPGLVVFLLCLVSSPALLAQPEQPYTVRVEVGLVNTDVAVVDARGKFVGGLSRRSFQILEDGVEQTITHFASVEEPLRLALLVETGPAVYLIRGEHLEAVHTLLDQLKPADAVALARYDQRWQLVANFTRDKRLLRARLPELSYSLGMAELNLLDALAATIDWLTPRGDPVPGRKAVLLIGTGLDTRSRTAREVLEKKLAAGQVTLFAIATGNLLRAPAEEKSGKKPGSKKGEASVGADFEVMFAAADARLRALAEETGGRAYFPRSARNFGAAYREIGERLRHTYSLGYVPTNRARAGAFRTLEIRLVDEAGRALPHRVIARRGYFAPRE